MSPGPGSYSKIYNLPDLTDLDTDTLLSLSELKNLINNDSSKLDFMFIKENASQLKKLHEVITNLQKAKNGSGLEGPKFPKADRF